MHNILRRRRSEPDESSFNLGENLLDMNEETMELAMEEVEGMDTLKEATQKEEQGVVDINMQAAGVDVVSRREPDDDNSFDLGENVLDMNEETMELAMEEEEEETMSTEGLVDVKERTVQAKVNLNPFFPAKMVKRFDLQEKKSSMMEVMDESSLEEELEEADKVGLVCFSPFCS